MNSSLNSWALCAEVPYLTGPGHSAAAAPVPPASLSECSVSQSIWQGHFQILLNSSLSLTIMDFNKVFCSI